VILVNSINVTVLLPYFSSPYLGSNQGPSAHIDNSHLEENVTYRSTKPLADQEE
jgi:hypothetical protein